MGKGVLGCVARLLTNLMAHRLAPLLVAAAGVCFGGGASGQTLSAAFIGPPEAVFDTKTQSCEPTDIPDISAQAFRDQNNQVHLFATHSIARAMVGPNLNQLTRQCNVVYRAPLDPNPAHFDQYNWLSGFYTADGRNVAALMHTEFHGTEVPALCVVPKQRMYECWWDTIAYAVSHDGGNSFATPAPPGNLVADLPYQYARGSPPGPAGYRQPTGIVQFGAFYYAIINDWGYRDQKFGACLMRTANPFDPRSWRAWDGSGFNVQFIDPYLVTNANPSQHVCAPVGGRSVFAVDSLSYLTASKLFVATEITHDRRHGSPGIFLSTSPDLIHWSGPVQLIEAGAMLAAEAPGKWDYLYLSILDPAATDRDFVTITDKPYLYYVRFNKLHPPLERTLLRRQISLTVKN